MVGLLAGTVTGITHASGETASWKIDRVAGADRYGTAALLSARTFPDGAAEVVVASGETFADALAAGPAAARRNGPLLLTGRDLLPSSTINELRRLHPTSIVLAGGPAAVSSRVEYALGTIAAVTRIGGTDRFETATKLASASFGTGVPVAFLANGRSFPDALAAGAAAGRLGGPVLLVEQSSLPGVVRDAIEQLRPARMLLVGGQAATSDALRTALLPHQNVDRVGGADRFETAAALAAMVPDSSGTAMVASGWNFPDALAAGPSVVASAGTLALTPGNCLTTSSAQVMADDGVSDVVIVGGRAAVPSSGADPCSPVATTTTTTSSTTTTTSTTSTTSTTVATTSTSAPGGTTTTTTPPSPTLPTLDIRSAALTEDSPDPAVLRVGDTWYAYSTQVLFVKVPVRTSTDLVTWSAPGEALPDLPAWADFGANWAPSVVEAGDGTYVLWYAARDKVSGRQCVSRAVATDPAGPFVDELADAPVCQLTLGGSIDPHVFTDTDGSRWLYWKSDENALGKPTHLWAQRLSANARSLSGSPTRVLSQTATWEAPAIEQPSVTRVGDDYYLFYSGGWWESMGYGVGIAVGRSPTGPFTKLTGTKPWLASAAGMKGPGALDVFEGPDGALWAAFHAWGNTVGYANGGSRTTRFGILTFG